MLKATNLTKYYGKHLALDGLDLEVQAGEIFCLLGANGAGKSTTINLFLDFIKPSEGEAFIGGIKVEKEPIKTKELITYIPENLVLYGNLTGVENLQYFLSLAGKKLKSKSLEMFLEEAGLQSEAFYQRVKGYSKGMRQKVGIALALAKKSKVLLLDEPTSGLDPKASNEFSELLIKLSELGVATLMATHDLFRAKETGDRIGIMRSGQLIENMSTKEVGHTDLEKLYLDRMK